MFCALLGQVSRERLQDHSSSGFDFISMRDFHCFIFGHKLRN